MQTATPESVPLPFPGESQPDFAIRFHESMMASIPGTDERNAACFSYWRKHTGEEPVVEIVRHAMKSQIGSGKFVERRDIPIFEEHVTSGGDKYTRSELVSLIHSMNGRIEDAGLCSPISQGHTTGNPGEPEPVVLGYTGANRLGMVGNKNPRWAIFSDEYHRQDSLDELDRRRGRSVEVWKYPRMEDRFFHPIAALGSETPRLNLPPARYRRRDTAGTDIEVDQYTMPGVVSYGAMPGGSNTFAPDGGGVRREHYESDGPESSTINGIMTALMNTAPMQFLMSLMEREGASGSPVPMVNQPPEIDPAAMLGGGDMGMGGGTGPLPQGNLNQGGFPMSDQNQPGQGQNQPGLGQGQQGQPGQVPGQQPQPHQQRYSRPTVADEINRRIELLEAENGKLRKELSDERGHRIHAERFSRINSLAQVYDVDPAAEMEHVGTMSSDQFEKHCEVIADRYRRREETVTDFSVMSGVGQPTAPNRGQDGLPGELGPKDAEAVTKYALKHGLDYETARERYIADRKGSTAG